MTRAPEATGKPLVRIVTGPDGRDAELVAAITTLGVTLRPKRIRLPDAAVARRSPPRRRVARGLLAAEPR